MLFVTCIKDINDMNTLLHEIKKNDLQIYVTQLQSYHAKKKKNNMELIMLPQAFGCILRKIAFVKNKHLLKFP